jgi:hypothetical protein
MSADQRRAPAGISGDQVAVKRTTGEKTKRRKAVKAPRRNATTPAPHTNSESAREFTFWPEWGSDLPKFYEVVQQPPESDGECQYKIKSVDEPHLRVAKESQLRRA